MNINTQDICDMFHIGQVVNVNGEDFRTGTIIAIDPENNFIRVESLLGTYEADVAPSQLSCNTDLIMHS